MSVGGACMQQLLHLMRFVSMQMYSNGLGMRNPCDDVNNAEENIEKAPVTRCIS